MTLSVGTKLSGDSGGVCSGSVDKAGSPELVHY